MTESDLIARARGFLGDWRENDNASEARAFLAAVLDEVEANAALRRDASLRFKALLHVPRVDEATDRLTGGCVPSCPGCEQEAAVAELVAERDRYREALERIYQTGRGLHVELARDALNG